MADGTTTTYGLTKPEVGSSEDTWGEKINGVIDDLDDLLDGTTPVTGIDINSGTVDGVTIGGSSAPTVTDIDINGGTIDGVTIGGASAGAGTFTTLTATGNVDFDGGTIKLDGNYPVGTSNVALGDAALDSGSLSGAANTAIGDGALTNNTSGAQNTAIGAGALLDNTSGGFNTSVGRQSLTNNTTASNNTAVGYEALKANTTGGTNIAVGNLALLDNTTGGNNTAVGFEALGSNTTGVRNTAFGRDAGQNLTSDNNTLIGESAGEEITSGSKNTIIGRYNGNAGGLDIRTSSNNIVLSDGDGNPRIHVYSDGRTDILSDDDAGFALVGVNRSSSAPNGCLMYFENYSPDNNVHYFYAGQDNTTVRFKVFSDGDVVNHDNSYGAISDVKLKEQITDASSQWDDIKSLNIRKYKMKSDVAEKGDSDEHWRLGVIAQEVEAAGMSGLIKTSPDMIENEDGKQVESGEYTKQVKYSILYMKAVKALQEAMDRIETLEAKVEALENQ